MGGMNRTDMKSVVVPLLASCGVFPADGGAEDELHLRCGPESDNSVILLDEFSFFPEIELERSDGVIRVSHQMRTKDPICACREGRLIIVSGSARKSKPYRDYVFPVCNFSHELARSGQATSLGRLMGFLCCDSVLL